MSGLRRFIDRISSGGVVRSMIDKHAPTPFTTRKRWLAPTIFAVSWLVLAIFSGDVTFHLAPVIVAAAAPLSSRHSRLLWAVFGFGLAAAATAALSYSGHLTGPSLLPFGGAAMESLIGAAVGALLGAVGAGRFEAGTTLSDGRP